jgi:hypothetical protein
MYPSPSINDQYRHQPGFAWLLANLGVSAALR